MVSDGAVLRMPANFLWGAATAAHQNEGHNHNNQWARWEEQPGRIRDGRRCGATTHWWDLVAAEADFDRAAELGLNSLRLSVEWSRIEPEEGVIDRSTLQQYQAMIRLLRERQIEPMVTLHHFTDPLWLTRQGGWENPRVTERFARFAGRVVEALGDQVRLWCTINEPFVYAYEGYMDGIFPPGVKSLPRTLRVLRRMLLTHGRVYRLIHALQNEAQVGLAHNLRVFLPVDPASPGDRRAAGVLDQIMNRATLEAMLNGRLVPPLGWGQTAPQLIDSADYIGLNYYTPERVRADRTRPARLFMRHYFDPQAELSEETMGGTPYGEVNPEGLYLALVRLGQYGKPIYITENGLPDAEDRIRPRFIATHLAAAWRAVQEGVDLRGYYHWTLVDNFEWCEGYTLRFGLYELDLATGARAPKASAAVYSRIIQANGIARQVLEKVAPGEVERYFQGNRVKPKPPGR